jgi:hypothetical protein
MKTSLIKNKKFWATAFAILVSMSILFGFWTVVYAKEQRTVEAPTEDTAVQTEVEVNVTYIFEGGEIFKEEIIKAEKGQLLDSGDLPMLPDDMKFIDEFLFYEVKGDGNDEIIRKVAKIENEGTETVETENPEQDTQVTDETTQTETPQTEDKSTQTEKPSTEDKGTQTDLTEYDISEMEKKSKELQDELYKLNYELRDKDRLSERQKDKIKDLEEEIVKLKEKLEKDKENKDLSSDIKKEIDKLFEKIKELEKKANEADKAPVIQNPIIPYNPSYGLKTNFDTSPQMPQTIKTPQMPENTTSKGTAPITSGTTVKDTTNYQMKEQEQEIRYPNKLIPKAPANNSGQDSQSDGMNKNVKPNKGGASAPSKARASVTENKDNANKDYPIHHNGNSENKETDKYSADARQFITFQTKSGKTFHLIINHDEKSENVMLLTEVSEDDLLNFIEAKEKTEPVKEVVKEEPVKETVELEKKEESNMGTYLILFLVVFGALGAGYYFKVVKKKEDKELEGFEGDDDFFSEAEDYDENDEEVIETDDGEVLEDNEDEE